MSRRDAQLTAACRAAPPRVHCLRGSGREQSPLCHSFIYYSIYDSHIFSDDDLKFLIIRKLACSSLVVMCENCGYIRIYYAVVYMCVRREYKFC